MIIEIGTSDFRTQAGQVDGVFIEPVPYYYKRLISLAHSRVSTKTMHARTHYINAAISDYTGENTMHYVNRQEIEARGLPQWVGGCSSMGDYHPSVLAICEQYGIDPAELCDSVKVHVVRIKSIIDKYNIKALDLLKIDTEGHDCIILNDYLNTVEILPKVIQFESNELSDPKEVAKVVSRLKPLGYDCKQVRFDMICKLR